MDIVLQQIENLDISLFDAIPSQTSNADRRSLLAVQRATASKHSEFVYLEIGSHLGGSIQPYLVDHRCSKIYSIDPRPFKQPDDRSPGYVATYEHNSTERMLDVLRKINAVATSKIECFEMDASRIDINKLDWTPDLAFIDGQHTKTQVLSDFHFCSKIVSEDGTILFHDFGYIFPAIVKICKALQKYKRNFIPLKLGGSVFGIFLDPDTVYSDPFLANLYARNKLFLLKYRIKYNLKKILPGPLLALLLRGWGLLRTGKAYHAAYAVLSGHS